MTLKHTLLRFHEQGALECGIDECGRGSLAGPVVAAAVVWTDEEGELDKYIRDSKKLNARQREELSAYIKDRAIDWSVQFIDHTKVDKMNILQATMKAMHNCLDEIRVPFDSILVDGNTFHSYNGIPHTCVIKGDDTYMSIAAASILAKTARDEYMREMHKNYPQYKWDTNVGYGTSDHMQAIETHGLSPLHRTTFCKRWLPGR